MTGLVVQACRPELQAAAARGVAENQGAEKEKSAGAHGRWAQSSGDRLPEQISVPPRAAPYSKLVAIAEFAENHLGAETTNHSA
jgi:hypothetical protein